MKVLVVGSGGREHTLVWKIKQSPKVTEVHCAPGNAGISQLAKCVNIRADELEKLADYAEQVGIDLTVVGPEAPLVAGIVEVFQQRGMRIFGPDKAAAQIEGSKVFCKRLLSQWKIPTAEFEVFTEPEAARRYIQEKGAPIVVKASGLAAGKGSIVCRSVQEALAAVERIMVQREFGASGDEVVVEECLRGQEASIMVFTDGQTVKPMLPSQDHKPVFDNDEGPNTGGMGAYCPVPVIDEALFDQIIEGIIKPTIAALAAAGCLYKGVLYAGLMLTEKGPMVLEYNARFGDPETQCVLPLLESDLVDVLEAVVDGRLDEVDLHWSHRKCVCVVMASGGYPGSYETGKPISGLEEAERLRGVVVFHAGTARRNGQFITNGGRVLGVTTVGDDFEQAIALAYEAAGKIHFHRVHYRTDIGKKAVKAVKG